MGVRSPAACPGPVRAGRAAAERHERFAPVTALAPGALTALIAGRLPVPSLSCTGAATRLTPAQPSQRPRRAGPSESVQTLGSAAEPAQGAGKGALGRLPERQAGLAPPADLPGDSPPGHPRPLLLPRQPMTSTSLLRCVSPTMMAAKPLAHSVHCSASGSADGPGRIPRCDHPLHETANSRSAWSGGVIAFEVVGSKSRVRPAEAFLTSKPSHPGMVAVAQDPRRASSARGGFGLVGFLPRLPQAGAVLLADPRPGAMCRPCRTIGTPARDQRPSAENTPTGIF